MDIYTALTRLAMYNWNAITTIAGLLFLANHVLATFR